MYIVRDIMHCKPGMVRPMVNKFQELAKYMKKAGMGSMRVMTDVSGENYWTVVSEVEVKDLGEYAEMSRSTMADPKLQKIMKDYHDFVDSGRREIFMIEG